MHSLLIKSPRPKKLSSRRFEKIVLLNRSDLRAAYISFKTEGYFENFSLKNFRINPDELNALKESAGGMRSTLHTRRSAGRSHVTLIANRLVDVRSSIVKMQAIDDIIRRTTIENGQKYYRDHKAEILECYAGKYVAIINDKVVDADEDFSYLADRVYGKYGYKTIYMPFVQRGEGDYLAPSVVIENK